MLGSQKMSLDSRFFSLQDCLLFVICRVPSLTDLDLTSTAAKGTLTALRAVLSLYTTNYVYNIYNYFPILIIYTRQ